MLTPQQLLTTTNKITPTTREKSIIISITCFTTISTWDSMIITNGNDKRITIGNLVKTKLKDQQQHQSKHI